MEKVYAEELTVNLSDLTLYQALKFLLEADDSELAPEVYEAHRKYIYPRAPGRNVSLWWCAWGYLLRLIRLPNVIVSNVERWRDTLHLLKILNRRNIPGHIEAVYNATAYVYSKNFEERPTAQGIVSFEDQTINSSVLPTNFPHIDPEAFA